MLITLRGIAQCHSDGRVQFWGLVHYFHGYFLEQLLNDTAVKRGEPTVLVTYPEIKRICSFAATIK